MGSILLIAGDAMRAPYVHKPLIAASLLALAGTASALDVAALPEDLTELSLDALLQIEVVSVSRQAEPLQTAAAAIFVVTGDDIRRSGARNIPEALRLVPGLHVAQNGANEYAISARGFNSTSADKMEVLLDGRSVYTPLFSGVFWDTLDTYLGDIERIEVIRGPGATLWGANAVNGVINIVTRPATETLGTEIHAAVGTEQRAAGALRAGKAVGSASGIRLFAKAWELDDGLDRQGNEARAAQSFQQVGTRGDFEIGALQLGLAAGRYDSSRAVTTLATLNDPQGRPDYETARGSHLMLRPSWTSEGGARLSGHIYVDQYQRLSPTIYSEQRRTHDVQLQLQQEFGRHRLNAGLGYRQTEDQTGGPPLVIIWSPSERTARTRSAFVQDQIGFFDRRLVWTLGSKFEHNDYTGDEVQPGTRLGYQFSDRWFSWAAVSRAVRTPNRLDHDTALYCDPVVLAPLLGCTPDSIVPFGSRDFEAERLTAWEWGVRYTDQQAVSADLALFYNDYDKIRTQEGGGFGAQGNLGAIRSYGGELLLNWRIRPGLDLRAHVSQLRLLAETRAASTDANFGERERTDPQQQAGLRLMWSSGERFNADAYLRYVGGFDQYSGTAPMPRQRDRVPAYTELNARVAWRPQPEMELALIGQNLFDAAHPEFGTAADGRQAERAVRMEWIWSW